MESFFDGYSSGIRAVKLKGRIIARMTYLAETLSAIASEE
jgi:hypothetical protein